MGLFKPIYMKRNLNDAQKKKACDKVKSLTDKYTLADIYRRAPVEDVRYWAARQLIDMKASHQMLEEIYRTAPQAQIRDYAAWQLTQMNVPTALLEDIALRCKDSFARQKAIEALNDPDALVRVVLDEKNSEYVVSSAALDRLVALGNEKALMQVSMGKDGHHKTVAAIGDEAMLIEIARRSKSGYARAAAVRKLKDPDTLIAALSDENGMVRAAALERIDNPETLNAAAFDPDQSVRKAVVQRIRDCGTLARVIREDTEWAVREEAVKNPAMNDPEVLAKAALEDDHWGVRLEVIKKPELTDQAVLAKIVLNDDSDHVRGEAIRKLNDVPALLKATERADGNWDSSSWKAALKLSEIAPDEAIAPMVRLMQRDRGSMNSNSKDAMIRAADFLEKRYKEKGRPTDRKLIATLPDGWYGVHERHTECTHGDEIAHFDLRR